MILLSLVYSQSCATLLTIYFQNIVLSPQRNPIPISPYSLFPFPSGLWHPLTYFSLFGFVYFAYFIQMDWHHICLFCLDSFTWHNVSKVHSGCSMNQYFFLWPRTISLYWFTTFCLSIHLLVDIFVVSSFWLLWTFCVDITIFFPFSPLSLSVLFWCIYLGVEFLGCVACVLSCIWLFSTHGLQAARLPLHGISQARIPERVAISHSTGSSWPKNWIRISCIGRQILYHWATWKWGCVVLKDISQFRSLRPGPCPFWTLHPGSYHALAQTTLFSCLSRQMQLSEHTVPWHILPFTFHLPFGMPFPWPLHLGDSSKFHFGHHHQLGILQWTKTNPCSHSAHVGAGGIGKKIKQCITHIHLASLCLGNWCRKEDSMFLPSWYPGVATRFILASGLWIGRICWFWEGAFKKWMGFLQVAQWSRICPPMQETQETQLRSLGQEDPLEKEMATHSSILAGGSHGQRSLVGYSPWGHKRDGDHGAFMGFLHGLSLL